MADEAFVHGRDSLAARKHFAHLQKGRCAICARRSERLVLDHEHSDLSLCRGLLCNACNMALGLFEDDPDRLAAAIAYLAGHQERNASYAETADAQQRVLRAVFRPLTEDEREARDAKILTLFEQGWSTGSLALRFALSRSQVNRIVSRAA